MLRHDKAAWKNIYTHIGIMWKDGRMVFARRATTGAFVAVNPHTDIFEDNLRGPLRYGITQSSKSVKSKVVISQDVINDAIAKKQRERNEVAAGKMKSRASTKKGTQLIEYMVNGMQIPILNLIGTSKGNKFKLEKYGIDFFIGAAKLGGAAWFKLWCLKFGLEPASKMKKVALQCWYHFQVSILRMLFMNAHLLGGNLRPNDNHVYPCTRIRDVSHFASENGGLYWMDDQSNETHSTFYIGGIDGATSDVASVFNSVKSENVRDLSLQNTFPKYGELVMKFDRDQKLLMINREYKYSSYSDYRTNVVPLWINWHGNIWKPDPESFGVNSQSTKDWLEEKFNGESEEISFETPIKTSKKKSKRKYSRQGRDSSNNPNISNLFALTDNDTIAMYV